MPWLVWGLSVTFSLSDRTSWRDPRTTARVWIFCIVSVCVGVVIYPSVREDLASSPESLQEVLELMSGCAPIEELPTVYRELWERHRPIRIAFERIALDLQSHLDSPVLYFNSSYVGQLTDELHQYVLQNVSDCLFILARYAVCGETPLKKAMALIAIRHLYPKKIAVVFAAKHSSEDDGALKLLSVRVLGNRFTLTNLDDKFTPKYFDELLEAAGQRE
jgi:hypothetical protein